MPESVVFPQFRRYKNGKSVFKINSMSNFVELQMIGEHVIRHEINAKILPDRNFIADMIKDYELNWELISAAEYNLIADTINHQQ